MSQINVPQNSDNAGTIIGSLLSLGVIVAVSFCCFGCSKNDSSYTPSSSSRTLPSPASPTTPIHSSSFESSTKKAVVISQNANLRKSNSANSEVIQIIPEGTNVEIVNQEGAWFLVKNNSQSGWLHGNTIRLITPSTSSSLNSSSDSSYQRTTPSYDPNAPLLPRSKDDIEPLYNEVQRLKEQKGMTDKEAVDKILRDAGEIP